MGVTSIANNAFGALVRATDIAINGNTRLTTIGFPWPLSCSLERVDLSGNALRSLSVDMMGYCSKTLQRLSLADNDLAVLPHNLFGRPFEALLELCARS